MSIPIETWRWLASPEGQAAVEAAPEDATASAVSKLRKRYDAAQVRGIIESVSARRKATTKLDPLWVRSLLADIAGVEMASSARSATHKAKRFAECLGGGAHVVDLCCGIGADSWGLASTGLQVTGVDHDEARAVMYTHNLPECSYICGDVLSCSVGEAAAFHLDPARRSDSGRTRRIEDFSPGPGAWDAVIQRFGTGAIKLNPGVEADALPVGELEILSEPGGLTQAVLWIGDLAGDEPRRATLLGEDGAVCSIAGEPHRPDDAHAVEGYIGTLDPCVERADLVGSLLTQIGVRLVHPGTGLVTGSSPEAHPMVRWYRVLEVMPWNEKRVRSALRERSAGVVEIRTRGGVVNTDAVQRRLRGDGERHDLSVLVYRLGGRVIAVLAERACEETPVCVGSRTGVIEGAS